MWWSAHRRLEDRHLLARRLRLLRKKMRDRVKRDLLRARQALTPLVPLVDGYFERAEALKAHGWYSFEPCWAFRRSLCSPDDWEIYRRYYVESKKEGLGSYRSDFMEELRAKQPNEKMHRLTVCDRNYWDLEKTAEYQVAWAPFKQEQMRLRRHEIELHATHISRQCHDHDEKARRIRVWGAVVKEMSEPIGFATTSKIGGRYSPIFRRALTPEWQLVLGVDVGNLGLEKGETIARPPGMGPLPIGQHTMWRALVPASKAKVQVGDPELIFLPQVFFPFDRAYSNFWDLEGLEINVRAEMTALTMLWPDLESRLIEGVSVL